MRGAAGCALLLVAAGCAGRTAYTHGEIPRDTYGEPVWAEIGPSRPRPDHGPILVPAGPPVRTVDGRIVQTDG